MKCWCFAEITEYNKGKASPTALPKQQLQVLDRGHFWTSKMSFGGNMYVYGEGWDSSSFPLPVLASHPSLGVTLNMRILPAHTAVLNPFSPRGEHSTKPLLSLLPRESEANIFLNHWSDWRLCYASDRLCVEGYYLIPSQTHHTQK